MFPVGLALFGPGIGAEANPMAWYFRVVEHEDRSWMCSRGLQVFDAHRILADAIEHINVLAAAYSPAEVFVHRIDGSVESLGELA